MNILKPQKVKFDESEKIDLKIVPSINSSNIYSINENTEIKIKNRIFSNFYGL